VTADAISEAFEKHGSLVEAIESLRGGERTLEPLSGEVPPEVDEWVPEADLLDPETPVEPDELFNHFVSPDQQPSAYRHLLKVILLLAGVLGLAALWRWTPASEWLDIGSAMGAAEWIRQQPLSPLLVLAAHVAGGLVAFPVTLMIIATVVVFGPWWGTGYSLLGSALSAMATFGAGRLVGRDVVRRLSGSLVNRISRTLAQSGLLTVITLRVVPVAPFSIINVIAGVSGIRFRDFVLGTLIGMTPGVVAIGVLADRIAQSLRQPELGSFAALAAAIAAVGLGLVALRRWLRRKRAEKKH
jgi:phospholipase D1/2